ncbi:hypothetical protein PROFUN_10243 [Planoprotostelium fungivorum]|uniref:START domain-containing protein n=1 Tax=Planoprotostelium fungivorum TaxID=1890364 RepID=A0A2P6NEF2_9EUKA|nr:hypothetical protein PROFUN_10243 [Planoprotostelium fungivorum]
MSADDDAWAHRMRELLPWKFDTKKSEMMYNVWKAQHTPNTKRLAKLEDMIRRLLDEYSDDNISQSSFDSSRTSAHGRFLEKLNDSHWKLSRDREGVKQYTWNKGDGLAARVEADTDGDVGTLSQFVEEIFRDIKLFTSRQFRTIDEDRVVQCKVLTPFPFTPRFISAKISIYNEPDESIALIQDEEREKAPSGHQRGRVQLSGVRMMRLDERRVRVSVMIHVDMCSNVPNWVLSSQNTALKKNLFQIMKAQKK